MSGERVFPVDATTADGRFLRNVCWSLHQCEPTGRKRVDLVRDGLERRSSATTDRYLKSDHRERLAYAQAMGEQLFKQVA